MVEEKTMILIRFIFPNNIMIPWKKPPGARDWMKKG
jgi:hypothetical protein